MSKGSKLSPGYQAALIRKVFMILRGWRWLSGSNASKQAHRSEFGFLAPTDKPGTALPICNPSAEGREEGGGSLEIAALL